MFKIKGEEFPVSLLKVFLHDNTFKQLELLQVVYKTDNNKHTLTVLIDACYQHAVKMIKEMEDQKESSVPQESENKDVK